MYEKKLITQFHCLWESAFPCFFVLLHYKNYTINVQQIKFTILYCGNGAICRFMFVK